jgi:hypothetical protein
MNRCSQCVLPKGTPGLTFQGEVCEECRNYRKLTYEGEAKLLALLDSYRRPGRRYDCIVTLSGGRDSSYTLLKLVRDYGMKVLAVNYRNPFTHPQARKNIDNAVRILGVDLVDFTLPSSVHERTFRDVTSAWFRDPSPALIPMICMACKTVHQGFIRIARQNGIRCMVNGGNRFEDISFKKVLVGVDASVSAERAITTALAGLLKQTWRHRSYLKPYLFPTLVKGFLFADQYSPGSRLFGHRIARIDLFFFVPWDEKTILSRLRAELGWDSPPESTSTWRFDCRIGHLKDWMYRTTLGLSERDDFYSKMIREGAISRNEALQRLRAEEPEGTDAVARLLRDNGMDPAVLRTVASMPHAWS